MGRSPGTRAAVEMPLMLIQRYREKVSAFTLSGSSVLPGVTDFSRSFVNSASSVHQALGKLAKKQHVLQDPACFVSSPRVPCQENNVSFTQVDLTDACC